MNNYSESVIIPFFQKKISELQGNVIVLEANLLVEQQKTKDILQQSAEEKKDGHSEINELRSQLSALKTSSGDNAKRLDDSLSLNSVLTKRIEELKKFIESQSNKIVQLTSDLKNVNDELVALKASNVSGKKKSEKKTRQVVLDGSTF